jgi:large subunit ribosomal protein L4
MTMDSKIVDINNKDAGTIALADEVFAVALRPDLIQRTVNWQLAKRRAGTHKTKGISEVQGTTRKPFAQKGGGRARQGSLRSPQMRGGSVTFGPVPRDHGYKLPKKVRKLALRSALSGKQADGKLVVLDSTTIKSGRTKDLVKLLAKLGWTKPLIIDGPEVNADFARAAANIRDLDVLPQQGINVYDILRCDTLVLTKAAVEHLEARLK